MFGKVKAAAAAFSKDPQSLVLPERVLLPDPPLPPALASGEAAWRWEGLDCSQYQGSASRLRGGHFAERQAERLPEDVQPLLQPRSLPPP